MNIQSTLTALLRFALSNGQGWDNQDYSPESLEYIYALASRHDLAHLVCHALEQVPAPECPAMEKFRAAKTQAIFRYMKLDHALNQIRICLQEAQIPFMPLKGAVIRDLYPEPWMRTSCDVDVLVHKEDLDRAVASLTSLGWKQEGKIAYHDISLYSPSGVHLELHFSILENMEPIDRMLAQVWDYSTPVNGFEYRQSNEFLIYHLLAHMSYHFLGGGCGIRAIMDIRLLRNKLHYDEAALRKLCREAELEKFYEAVVRLTDVWFEGAVHSQLTGRMEQIILSGGTYGSIDGSAAFKQVRAGGKGKHILQRIIMPYEAMIIRYPILKKHSWLTPIFQIVRWIQTVFNGRLKYSVYELKVNSTSDESDFKQAEALMRELGLHQ